MTNERMDRRHWVSRAVAGLGATAAGLMAWKVDTSAQTPVASPAFQPARHAADAWLDTVPGKHRVVVDTISPAGASDGIGYATNVFSANLSGYQLENADVALVLCLRHNATAFAFNNAMWAKYGKVFADRVGYKAADGATPTANPRNSGERPALDRLAARGAHFIVCGLSTNLYAGLIAGQDGDRAAVFKELGANTVANAHIMAAGVVGITRAQEYGYSLIYVG